LNRHATEVTPEGGSRPYHPPMRWLALVLIVSALAGVGAHQPGPAPGQLLEASTRIARIPWGGELGPLLGSRPVPALAAIGAQQPLPAPDRVLATDTSVARLVPARAAIGPQQPLPASNRVLATDTSVARLAPEGALIPPIKSGRVSAPAGGAVQQPPRAPVGTSAPPDTDVWLARLGPDGAITQPINITDRKGYDNQPSFTPDGKAILFTRRDGEQTDIYTYDFTSRSSLPTPVTNTPESEYSPTVTPDGAGISVIRVEADGSQRLWRFTRDGQSPQLVLANVKPVGYHAWGPGGTLALFVLGNPNTLQVADTRTGRATIVAQRIGRSLHRIPGRGTISVLHSEGDVRWIKALDIGTRTLTPIVRAIESADGDYAWTPDGAILMSDGQRLMRSSGDGQWQAAADLSALGLEGVSRLAVSPDGRWLAMVVPERK
jgi:hypothetical protein